MSVLEHKNISGRAYEVVLEMIITRKLRPGEKLVEQQLAERLGISRTPLREAIGRLAKDGLVVLEDRKGASVNKFGIDDVREVYDIRKMLEGFAARQSAENIELKKLEKLKQLFESSDSKDLLRADSQLHDLVINSCENKRLISLLNDLKTFVQIFRAEGYTSKGRSVSATLDHKGILEALMERDGRKAELLMQEHLEKTKQQILDSFEQKGN